MNKILSCDQSTTCSGISCFINGQYQWTKLVDLKKEKDSELRFKHMVTSIYKIIEKEKPDEWFKIGDIDSYYTQRMDLLQKQVELYQDALKDTSDMTDEQIQNIVDSLNEATLNLKQAQIDNLKDQTDLQSKQYDAIVYRINLWKDEIQDAIDAIEKAYEDEIKPIQDVSDELER